MPANPLGPRLKQYPPLEEWTGKIFDDRSENFVRVISDQEWKQLNPGVAFSHLDFTKEMVVAIAVNGSDACDGLSVFLWEELDDHVVLRF